MFQSFVGAFNSRQKPLTIFLDNLHWADEASLKLLQTLMSSSAMNGMLILGAYRDNEVNNDHVLKHTMDALEQRRDDIVNISLKALDNQEVGEMVSGVLRCTIDEAGPLTQLVYGKTEGNPFFVNEFLKNLHQNALIRFSFSTGRWGWDVDRILQADTADDLVGLMTEKIKGLSQAGQRALMHAACIGYRFAHSTLAEIHEVPREVCTQNLQEAVRAGLVLPEYKPSEAILIDGNTGTEGSTGVYKFLHDRVQQAAYSLLTTEQSKQLHIRIGRLMLDSTPLEHLDEHVCEISDHMNRGRSMLKDAAERVRLSELNLRAARRTKSSVAYESALRYAMAGADLLGDEGWQKHYELMLSLNLEGAETAYLCSRYSDSEQLITSVLLHTGSLLDRVRAHEISIHSQISQNRYEEAMDEASGILNQLGVFLPKNPGRLRILLGLIRTKILLHGISLQDLKNLPSMSDPVKAAAMRILMGVFNPFYRSIREMFPSIAFRMLMLSYKYGNSTLSPFAYALYGLLLGLIGEIDQGYQMGSFALDLFDTYHSKELTAKMYNVVYALMNKWKSHLREALQPLQAAYSSGLETGDLEWAAYSARSYCLQHFFVGADLELLKGETEAYAEKLNSIHQHNALHTVMLVRQAVLNLTGSGADTVQLRGECFDDEEMIPLLKEAKDTDTIAGIRFFKCMLCFSVWRLSGCL